MLEAPTNYNVSCLVKRKVAPVTLNVKGQGYAIHDSLQIDSTEGHAIELSSGTPNSVDFGQVCLAKLLVLVFHTPMHVLHPVSSEC